ncbi:MAG: hypothetical protein JXM70_22605 [Pirellulales bacterium]|nr:hypothetical protein [Pirellulales bacterium]
MCRLSFTFVAVALVSMSMARLVEAGFVIDHNDTDIMSLSLSSINLAKDTLHIGYGHTSHGSQVTTGMTAMNTFMNGDGLNNTYPDDTFKWVDSSSPPAGVLDLDDYFKSGDLGNPDRITWAASTRDYLNDPANSDVNVIMWSWCGQADTTAANIDIYLNLMNDLEEDYPDVNFVYMTGHTNGCSTTGNLFLRNQQIRDYCIANDKILYDFADIESWDPDGEYYGDKLVTDNCDYDSDGNGTRDKNWATDWQNSHEEGTDWFDCSCAHSQPLNGNQKAYAAWALWTEIAESIPYTPGDANRDGTVDVSDLGVLASHYGTGSGAEWGDGDFTGEGCVDVCDLGLLAAHYYEDSSSVAGVPEPGCVAMLLCGFLSLILSRRLR